jgi:hypothetical protein
LKGRVSRSGPIRRAPLFALSAVVGVLMAAAPAIAREDVTRDWHLKRCTGTIHAGFSAKERAHASHFGRYAKLSCTRARAIVKRVDSSNGRFPRGYGWMTPHGARSTWPTVFGRVLKATYLSPDGLLGSRSVPGIAVVIFD